MKYLKIILITLVALVIFLAAAFHIFSRVKSTRSILKVVGDSYVVDYKTYEDVTYRYLAPVNFDANKSTLLFIHGAIGSLLDFKKLITDDVVSETYNMLSFDRPNYGDIYDENYEHDIAFESEIALDVLSDYTSNEKNIVVGYSYGGPIAMITQFDESVDEVVLVAPAVDPESEVVPVLIELYKNKYTRFLVPRIWKEASQEKINHVEDLLEIVPLWSLVEKPIVHIHGTKDSLVPYSETFSFLDEHISSDMYSHIPVSGKGHAFVFSEKEVFTNLFLKK